MLRNKTGRDSERPAHSDEEWHPLAATRESLCTATKTQCRKGGKEGRREGGREGGKEGRKEGRKEGKKYTP